jgi:hypothetical protein
LTLLYLVVQAKTLALLLKPPKVKERVGKGEGLPSN